MPYRCCDQVTPPPLTPSKARAGGLEARPVFTAPWTCLDDPASLRPLDHEPTATTELVPGALIEYTGTTTRDDLLGQLLPHIQNTNFSYLDSTQLCILLSKLHNIAAYPLLGARGLERGVGPQSCSNSNSLLASVNLSQTPSVTGNVSTPTSNMGSSQFADDSATPPPHPARLLRYFTISPFFHLARRTSAAHHPGVTASYPARGAYELTPTPYPTPAASRYLCPLGPSSLPPNRRPPRAYLGSSCTRRTPTDPHAADLGCSPPGRQLNCAPILGECMA